LGKLTALKRFAVCIQVADFRRATQFPWLSKILRSNYSTPVQLEELSIRIIYSDHCFPQVIDNLPWKDTFYTLLEDVRFKNLRALNILVAANSKRNVPEAVRILDCSPAIAKIRSRRNLAVDIRREYNVLLPLIIDSQP
jgi:hypothetical protein